MIYMDNNNTYLYFLVEYGILLNVQKISLLSLSLCIYAVYYIIASLTLLSSAEWSQVMDFTHVAASYSRAEIVTGWQMLHVTDWSVKSDQWQHVRHTTDIRPAYRQSCMSNLKAQCLRMQMRHIFSAWLCSWTEVCDQTRILSCTTTCLNSHQVVSFHVSVTYNQVIRDKTFGFCIYVIRPASILAVEGNEV